MTVLELKDIINSMQKSKSQSNLQKKQQSPVSNEIGFTNLLLAPITKINDD
jgi:hypothetical protein